MAMGLQDEQFAAGELARVLRTDDTTLQNWLRRSNLDLPAPIAGRRLFSAKFAFQLAILKELSLYGMGALQAGNVVKELLAQVPPDWLEQFVTGALDPDTVPLIIYHPRRAGFPAEDTKSGGTWHFYPSSGEPGLPRKAASGLLLSVGRIAKEVITQLRGVLLERKGTSEGVI